MKNKVLVVAVHPDDETLGCGGTLLKYKANSDEIYWLIVTAIKSGYRDWDLGFSKEVIEKRDKEIKSKEKIPTKEKQKIIKELKLENY